MGALGKAMYMDGDNAYISRYEVAEAFFRTEEEENSFMAIELNKMINIFYEKERQTKRNVDLLPFDLETFGQAIEYINSVSMV